MEEIRSIKPLWAQKYEWNPSVVEHDDHIDLFIRFVHPRGDGDGGSQRTFVLRLRFQEDYETAGRREAFVNPEKTAAEGLEFWPKGIRGINPDQFPANICLEGTWGFHSHHHRDRDGRVAKINRLLLEVERCLNPK